MGNLSKHFSREEFECQCGCGFNTVDYELVLVLEDLREHFGKPVTITSGCRCASHNKVVGGAPKSKHTLGLAADIKVKDTFALEVYTYLVNKYPSQYGIGKYYNWTHIDVRAGLATRW